MMKQFLFIICIFLFASCNRNTFDDPNKADYKLDPLTGNINTPTFNYMMGGSVELEINDVSSSAVYTIYTLNNDHKTKTDVEVTNPDTEKTEIFSVELPDAGSWSELGTIASQGNGANINIDVPNDIEELFIRKQDGTEVSFQSIKLSVKRPIERTVTFEAHAKSLNKSLQEENFSVLWGLNKREDLFTIDLCVDVSDLDAQLAEYPQNTDATSKVIYGPEPYDKYIYDLSGTRSGYVAYTLKDAEPKDDTRKLLEDGSYTIAMDDGNDGFYTIGKDQVRHLGDYMYPVYYYGLENMEDGNGEVAGHKIVGWLDFGVNRLECVEGFLYASTNRKIIKMIPRGDGTILILDTVPVSDLDNPQGGDIVATDPATSDDPQQWFMATHGGLYSLIWEKDMGVVADRKSASTLPFGVSSLAYSKFHYPNTLWIADYFGKAGIYAMDTQFGSYKRKYQLPINCNDLTCANAATNFVYEDQFPADDRYYKVVFPSKYGYGSVVFEDMYPLMKDYDFNDLVMDFRYEVYYTEKLRVHSMQVNFVVRNVTGASYKNGFGFSFDGVPSSWIKDVVFTNDKASGIFQRASNGVEAGLTTTEDAVFMVFDDQTQYRTGDKEIGVRIIFSDDATTADFYNGFNPFIFVDGKRELEVHLPDKPITSKADLDAFHEFHDIDWAQDLDFHDPVNDPDLTPNVDDDFRGYQKLEGNYYYGFPWVLVMPHSFKYPKEEAPITAAYPKFKDWANLNQVIDDYDMEEGSEERYEDWYSDKPGYQAHEYIEE